MDRISPLPDDLILKILSSPPTKVAITTSLLSKRWRYVWKHIPKLEYYAPPASTFIQNFLLLHEARVLETMNVRLAQHHHRPTDIEIWFRIAVARGVRRLRFHQDPLGPKVAIRLPECLYTCQTLVSLALFSAVIVDVPLTIRFPSLKTLRLRRVEFSNDEIVPRILSGCPVLEDLTIVRVNNGNMKTFTIMIPSLLRLAVLDLKSGSQVPGDDIGLVITAPFLTSLTVFSQVSWVCSLVNMPCLVTANIKLPPPGDSRKLLACLTSAKHLSLCAIPSKFSYPIGVFYHLVSLELCTCCSVWFCLILRQTPKLRVLRFQPIERCCDYVQIQWEQTSSVPQCLISSLKTVEWIDYQGRESEKKAVMYLLENSGQLRKMAIEALPSTSWEKRFKMLQELSSTQRSSKQCKFSFT